MDETLKTDLSIDNDSHQQETPVDPLLGNMLQHPLAVYEPDKSHIQPVEENTSHSLPLDVLTMLCQQRHLLHLVQ
jgi:hypothetical protein